MEIKNIVRIALITVIILLVPLIAMQFSDEVNWTASDFLAMGILLFVMGLIYDVVAKRIKDRNYRFVAGGLLVLIFLYLWAELAVGLFTNWGS